MRLSSEDKAGLYITAIIHLAVIIILLIFKIDAVSSVEFYVLDYTEAKPPEIKKKPEIQKPADLSEEDIRKLIAAAQSSGDREALRSIAVNAGLKDDRNTDVQKLYEDAERIAREMQENLRRKDTPEDYVSTPGPEEPTSEGGQPKAYSGPSVLSWELDGRQALYLPIPAYRCYGAGDVTVIITVNQIGQVTAARIDETFSSSDGCLRQRSLEAAKKSKFSRDDSREVQMGTIVYRFIAQ